ncbi:MAG: transposase [Velocimicrobium sp.]
MLYKMRWGEETSFRKLKYTIGLVNFHSRKKDFIIQEIYARMILYNFCELATNHAVVITSENTKHTYKINFATAVNVCRTYLKSGGDENEMMLVIQRHLTPIRPDRKYPLKLHPKRNRDFIYRVA